MRVKDEHVRRVVYVLKTKPGRFRAHSAHSLPKKLAHAAGLRDCGREYLEAVTAVAIQRYMSQDQSQ